MQSARLIVADCSVQRMKETQISITISHQMEPTDFAVRRHAALDVDIGCVVYATALAFGRLQ